MINNDYPLFPELIPSPCFGYNLRSFLKPVEWQSISKYVRERANGQCEICGERTYELEAHEMWEFNDVTHYQRLKDVKAVCPLCHRSFHIGQTKSQNNPELLQAVYGHMMKVNNCNERTLEQIIATAEMKWKMRSKYGWTIEVDDELLAELLEKGGKHR